MRQDFIQNVGNINSRKNFVLPTVDTLGVRALHYTSQMPNVTGKKTFKALKTFNVHALSKGSSLKFSEAKLHIHPL